MDHSLGASSKGPVLSRSLSRSSSDRLASFYAANASSATRLAYLLTGDSNVAQDLAQEAFIRVGTRLGSLRDPERALGYLYRTIVNLAKGYGRRQRSERALLGRLQPAEGVLSPDLAARDEVMRALLKLSPRHRTVLFLRHYLGLNEAEAARVLDLSPSATKSLTHRAAKAMRSELEEA